MNITATTDHRAAWQFTQPLPWRLKLRRLFRPAVFRCWRVWQQLANRHAGSTRVAGMALQTHPQVFHPGQHFSSKLLARYVARLPLREQRVLDMGTGSGVIGIVAARHGARVLAVDRNASAVALAQSNAAANGVALEVRHSDLFAALARTEQFDWIIFNPPFYAKPAHEELHAAYNAGAQHETLARFFAQAGQFLAPTGKVLLIVSSDMALAEIAALLAHMHYQLVHLETVPHWFEFFYLVQLATTSQRRVIQQESFSGLDNNSSA